MALFRKMSAVYTMNTLFKYLLIFILLLSCSACSAEIESSSANSISALLAVCGEYAFAVISLVCLLLIHCVRVVGVAMSTMAIYMICSNLRFGDMNASWLLLIGAFLILVSFITPLKYYEPKVLIAKNIAKVKKNETKKNSQKSLAFEIVIGVILIVLEQNIDFTIK